MSSPIERLDFTAETAESAERETGVKLNRWTEQIIGAAMTVHRELSPPEIRHRPSEQEAPSQTISIPLRSQRSPR